MTPSEEMLGNFTHSGPPEVRQAFEDLVADRDRLQTMVTGTLLAIDSILTDDHQDIGASAHVILGRVSAALRARIDPDRTVADLERERFARQAVDQALRDAVTERDRLAAQLAHEMNVGQSMEGDLHDLEDERNRLQAIMAESAQGMTGDIELVAGIYEFPLAPNLSTRFGFCPVCQMVWPPDGTHECQATGEGS